MEKDDKKLTWKKDKMQKNALGVIGFRYHIFFMILRPYKFLKFGTQPTQSLKNLFFF